MRQSLSCFVLLTLAAPAFAQQDAAVPVKDSPPISAVARQAQEGAPEGTRPISFGVETDASSRYVWRGLPFSEGAVQQSSLWASTRGFTFSVWSNLVTGKDPSKGKMNEVDYTISYAQEMKGWSFEPSVNVYTYPNGGTDSTAELMLKFARQFGQYSVYTGQSVDFVAGEGAYFGEIGASREWSLNQRSTLEGALSFGWASSKFNAFNAGVSSGGLHVIGGQLAWTYKAKGFYVRPHVGVTTLLNSKVRSAVDDSTILHGGLAIGTEF